MNWSKIKYKYPKAYTLCEKEMIKGSSTLFDFYETVNWNDRKLYDFFDEQGIMVWLIWENYPDVQWWHAVINWKDKQTSSSNWDIPNWKKREEAETVAFMKSFEILEKQITEN